MEDLTGKQLGPFQIVALIGTGGMATVYKAYQPNMERYVALKVLPQLLASDAQFVGRFRQEARVIAQLEHSHVLPVYDFGESEGYLYIAMRLVETGTLADKLQGQPLPLSQIRHIITQVGDALDYAHSRGVIHRDVKPTNVLIDQRGDCLLTDFGIAKMTEGTTEFTRTGGIVGTPAYMSPEQGLGDTLDHRSDIYSLGVVLYHMAVGQAPYAATTPMAIMLKHIQDRPPPPRNLNRALPVAVEQVIMRSLAKRPQDRYATVGEMVGALQTAIDAPETVYPEAQATLLEPAPEMVATFLEPVETPPPPPGTFSAQPAQPAPQAPQRRGFGLVAILGMLGGLGALLVVGAIGAVVIFALFFNDNNPPALPTTPVVQADTNTPVVIVVTQEITSTAAGGDSGNALADATRTPTPPPTEATPTPASGEEIAFTSDHDGADAIYVMSADGSNRVQLTNPSSPIQDWWPSWCSAGQRIVFERGDHKSGPDSQDIYEVSVGNPAGAREWSYVPAGSMWTGHPICSRDGRYVSFAALYPGENNFALWLADVARGEANMFGDGYSIPGSMDFSPDGSATVFSSLDEERKWILYTAKTARPYEAFDIQPSGVDGALFPAWSPDGRQIAFACRVSGDWGLCLTDRNGSYYDLLVPDLRLELAEREDIKFNAPTWSPDGQWIAYSSDADGDWDIYVIRADGTGKRNLTDGWSSNEFFPSWKP